MVDSSNASDNLLTQLDAEYQEGFAGKSRATVDASKLEDIVARAQAALKGEAGMSESLADGLRERVARYGRELDLIRAAQAGGESFQEFSLLGREANLIFAQYSRHFAGQSRTTRDVALLNEIVSDLERVQRDMHQVVNADSPKPMRDDVALVDDRLKTYKSEIQEIRKAHAAGSVEERATNLANRANAQFQQYQNLFAGKGRLTRRPALIERIIGNLESIHSEMKKLASAGFKSDVNEKNMSIVTERLTTYRTELVEIRKAREARKLEEIMNGLGGAANDVFKEYEQSFQGKERAGVDLAQLGRMLDELGEIRRQMIELGSFEPVDFNYRNEKIVSDRMQEWIDEHRRIAEAQQGSPNAPRP